MWVVALDISASPPGSSPFAARTSRGASGDDPGLPSVTPAGVGMAGGPFWIGADTGKPKRTTRIDEPLEVSKRSRTGLRPHAQKKVDCSL